MWEFAVAPAPLGLPLPDRGCCAEPWLVLLFGAAEAAGAGGGGGGAGAVLGAVGEVVDVLVVGGGSSEANDGLSWGAGERAMATAVLMIGVWPRGAWSCGVWVLWVLQESDRGESVAQRARRGEESAGGYGATAQAGRRPKNLGGQAAACLDH